MRDEFMRLLYERRGELKGIALVQGLKALESLVAKERAEPEKAADVVPHSLLDQLHAIPPAHAIGLLETEIARLDADKVAHQEALQEMKGLL